MTNNAFIVHAITDAPASAMLDFSLIEQSGLIALCTTEPADQLNQLFADPDWVAKKALEHHRLLSIHSKTVDLLPLRLGTICKSATSVRELLEQEQARFKNRLDVISGLMEFNIRIFIPTEISGPAQQNNPDATTGYLRRKADVQARMRAYKNEQTKAIEKALTSLSPFTQRLQHLAKRQDPKNNSEFEVCHIAIAVKREDVHPLEAQLAITSAELGVNNARMECVGPWPVYSFVAEDAA